LLNWEIRASPRVNIIANDENVIYLATSRTIEEPFHKNTDWDQNCYNASHIASSSDQFLCTRYVDFV
jgi:hypothetical protein